MSGSCEFVREKHYQMVPNKQGSMEEEHDPEAVSTGGPRSVN